MWEPQLRTPGISRRSRQALAEIRVSSDAPVAGSVSQCIRKSRSLKFGSSWRPKRGIDQEPGENQDAPPCTIAGRGRRITRVEDRPVAALQHAQQRGLALPELPLRAGGAGRARA